MCLIVTAAVAAGVLYLRSHPADLPAVLSPRPVVQEDSSKEDERFRVAPVDEPAMPLTPEEAKKAGFIPMKGGGYVFERKDGVEGVAVPGTVLMNRGVVELFACGVGGKEHESVLRIECDIQSFDMALTGCGFRRGRLPKDLRDKGVEQGERLLLFVQWKTKDERVVTHRAEDLLLHVKREAPMARTGWTFVGGWVDVVDPTSTPKERKTYKVLAAAASRSLVTTWRDPSTLFDNPNPDAVDDTLYAANFMVAPPSGTRVLVIVRAPSGREREEIAKAEEALSK